MISYPGNSAASLQVVHFYGDAYEIYRPQAMEWLLKREGKMEELPTVYEHVHGIGIWDFWAKNQEEAEVFNEAMTNINSLSEQLTTTSLTSLFD